MTFRLRTAISMACLTGVALLVMTGSVAYPQDDSDKSNQSEKKKPEARKVDVKVKVSATDGKRLPANSVVEISGQESPCGNLNSNDARATVDDKGEAIFHGVPACKVSVKINLNEYLPVTKRVDLTDYKSCAPQTPCEVVALVLEPVH